MDGLVLSGNRGIVLSGNESSCYQATKPAAKLILARVSASPNFPNLNTLTGSSSAAPRWTTATGREAQRQQAGFPTRRVRS
ncbi:hypothetical protein A8E36_17420 [Burkholderia cenocepacia]|uniref:Uncharacterized protein n=2 Tax=Burkholderiaceae TaxID=119060 RepID=A0A1V2W3Y6_9BURK|nr:hypothetical protein ACS15_1334 [Ralstonia insidiosa]ONS65576.1 hypothetical protein A8E33_08015 [Burkholderia cenocepacia]ONS69991.1 hypothetical protein A8E35_38295 [Burkholderia cenocepacia]ONS88466.1 hypothetical protein A8E34_04740 [Burkholderia cenocepacia]ONT03828.1 hypothetical protein A8E36_17420 [Burkholderia cenocepacia]